MRLQRVYQAGRVMILLGSALLTEPGAMGQVLRLTANGPDVPPPDRIALFPYVGVWVDTAGTATVTTLPQHARFVSFRAGDLTASRAQPVIWLQFRVRNTSSADTLKRLFFGGWQLTATLYADEPAARPPAGQPVGWLSGERPADRANAFVAPIVVPPAATRTFWFRATHCYAFNALTPTLFTADGYARFREGHFVAQRVHYGLYGTLAGLWLYMLVVASLHFFYSRNTINAYFLLQLCFSLLLLGLAADLAFDLRLVGPVGAALFIPVQYLLPVAYLLFYGTFLKLHQNNPLLHRVIIGLVSGLAVAAVGSFWAGVQSIEPLANGLAAGVPYVSLLVIAAIFGTVAQTPMANRMLFLIALGGVLAGATVRVLLDAFGLTAFGQIWTDPVAWVGLGAVVELIFYNFALTQRFRQSNRDKIELALKKQALEIEADNRVRELHHAIQESQEALLRGQTLERRRVASELHDTLGGTLAAVKLTLYSLNPTSLNSQEQRIYQQLAGMVAEAGKQLRQLSHNLLPDQLQESGLVPTLYALVDKLNLSGSVRFALRADTDLPALDKQTAFNLYAVCLELSHNTLKHAGATTAHIDLHYRDHLLELVVRDDGQGFPAGQVPSGMGLKNLHERAKAMGATVQIDSPEEGGTLIQLRVPVIEPGRIRSGSDVRS